MSAGSPTSASLPLLVDVDTGFGGAFNIARTVKSLIKFGAGAMHIEDQVQAKRCGHRPGKEIVPQDEMVDRIKAAVDARTDPGLRDHGPHRRAGRRGPAMRPSNAPRACVEAGADMIFPEAMTELAMYRKFVDAVEVPVLANITEFGQTPLFTVEELRSANVSLVLYPLSAFRAMNQAALMRLRDAAARGHAEECARRHADARRAVRLSRLPRVRAEARSSCSQRNANDE